MTKPQSLKGRAILALLLLAGFYLMAIGIALGLLYIPYSEWVYAERITLKLALFCVLGAGIILWSIIPRIDRFEPPGPRLLPEKHPKLFKEISEIAEATNQPMPAEVYLVFDINAWVAQRGGILGIGSKRIMGLGLPLLQTLTVSELKGVLAHEFGHYHGGDTKLGPIIYKTRSAIERTLEGLSQHSDIIQYPFILYGNFFLRITHAISRNQEYSADELAAKIVGSKHMIKGLCKISGAGMVFDAYWGDEVVPVLDSGYLPPFVEGFDTFLKTEPIKNFISETINKMLNESTDATYSTHPPLKERLGALELFPPEVGEGNEIISLNLLQNPKELVRELFITLFGDKAKELKPIEWNQVGEKVYITRWTELVIEYNSLLKDITLKSLPKSVGKEGEEFGQRLLELKQTLDPSEQKGLTNSILGAALSLALFKNGWKVQAIPGLPIRFVFDDKVIEPFSLIPQLISGNLLPEDLQQRVISSDLAELNLGQIA